MIIIIKFNAAYNEKTKHKRQLPKQLPGRHHSLIAFSSILLCPSIYTVFTEYNVHANKNKSNTFIEDHVCPFTSTRNKVYTGTATVGKLTRRLACTPVQRQQNITNFSWPFGNGLLSFFWVIYCGMNCNWVHFANCTVGYIMYL